MVESAEKVIDVGGPVKGPGDSALVVDEEVRSELAHPLERTGSTGLAWTGALEIAKSDPKALPRVYGEIIDGYDAEFYRRCSADNFVAFRDRDGRVFLRPDAQACKELLDVFKIQIEVVGPVSPDTKIPEALVYRDEAGKRAVKLCAHGLSLVTGEWARFVWMNRHESELFLGRATKIQRGNKREALNPDLTEIDMKACAYTGVTNKIAMILARKVRIPLEAWLRYGFKDGAYRKGHGFGSGDERRASGVAEPGLEDRKKALRDKVLSLVGGDITDAKKLMREITANPSKDFAGFDTVDRLTQGWQLKKAEKNLASHRTFGDSAGSRDPGAEG